MKRIVILCDGTWNRADQTFPTNVRQLSLLIPQRDPDGVEQKVLYFQGVGVPEKGGWLERINETISGGAMGWGLDDKIAVAFLHLARHYQPGDEVYVFGFSRGAYTARSLVGLIRNVGLPANPSHDLVRECFALYRDRGEDTSPDAGHSLRFRLRHSPGLTTSDEETAWRKTNGHPVGSPFRVTYLGIWDTVGALGIPSHWGMPARLANRKYRFHDTDLSRMVLSARHALALDEHRRHFVPTVWTNLENLRPLRPPGSYLQQWFAGDHGSVGGGGDVLGLANLSMAWVVAGACAAGLHVPEPVFERLGAMADPLAPLHNRSAGASFADWVMSLTAGWRDGPKDVADVAHPAVGRWRTERFPQGWKGKPYRPKSLARVEQGLSSFDLAMLQDYAKPPTTIV